MVVGFLLLFGFLNLFLFSLTEIKKRYSSNGFVSPKFVGAEHNVTCQLASLLPQLEGSCNYLGKQLSILKVQGSGGDGGLH